MTPERVPDHDQTSELRLLYHLDLRLFKAKRPESVWQKSFLFLAECAGIHNAK